MKEGGSVTVDLLNPLSVLCTMLAVKAVKVLELSLQCLHSAYTFQRTITTTAQFMMCYKACFTDKKTGIVDFSRQQTSQCQN